MVTHILSIPREWAVEVREVLKAERLKRLEELKGFI